MTNLFWKNFLYFDSLYYDEDTKKYYILYWLGSLFNNNNYSCASFMNLRDDGMPVKFVLNYTIYTVEDQVNNEMVCTEYKKTFKIDEMNLQELNDLNHDKLETMYKVNTIRRSLMGRFRETDKYTHMECFRKPVDGIIK